MTVCDAFIYVKKCSYPCFFCFKNELYVDEFAGKELLRRIQKRLHALICSLTHSSPMSYFYTLLKTSENCRCDDFTTVKQKINFSSSKHHTMNNYMFKVRTEKW